MTVRLTRWRGVLSRAAAFVVAAGLGTAPLMAAEPQAPAAKPKSIQASMQQAAAREVAKAPMTRKAAKRAEQDNPSKQSSGFFKTGPGIAALAVMAAGHRLRALFREPRPGSVAGETVRRGYRRMSKMKCIARLFALVFAWVLVASTAQAQTLVGTVQGRVADEQGAVLPGVNVTLTGPRGDQSAVTDEKGRIPIRRCHPGTSYRVKVDLRDSLRRSAATSPLKSGRPSRRISR